MCAAVQTGIGQPTKKKSETLKLRVSGKSPLATQAGYIVTGKRSMMVTNDAPRLAAARREHTPNRPPEAGLDNIAPVATYRQVELPVELHGRTPEQNAPAERLFQEAFEHASIGMASVSSDLLLIQVNTVFCGMLGYRETALLLTSLADIMHPEDAEACLLLFSQLAPDESCARKAVGRCLTADGGVIWVRVTMCSTIGACDGHPARFIAQFEDITERKAEEALAQK